MRKFERHILMVVRANVRRWQEVDCGSSRKQKVRLLPTADMPSCVFFLTHLLLLPLLLQITHHLSATLQIFSERFLNNNSILSLLGVAIILDLFSYGSEYARWEGHVEYSIPIVSTVRGFNLLEVLVEALEIFRRIVLPTDVGAHLDEAVNCRLRNRGDSLQVRSLALVELGFVHLRAGVSDDVQLLGEETILVQAEKSGEGLDTEAERYKKTSAKM